MMMNITQTYTNYIRHRYNPIIVYPAEEMGGDIILEIGPGRGDFLFHLAELHPEKTIYGIDIKGKRFDKLVRRRDTRRLNNVRLILADAAHAIPELFRDSSVESIFINFPDPWPKRRHTKKRLLNKPFLEECFRILIPGGSLSVTTDVEWYAREVFENLKAADQLISTTPNITTESDEVYPTLFAEKWKREGRTIYYQKHIKNLESVS